MIIVSPIIRLALKIASLVIYLITLLCAFGGYVPPAVFSFPSLMVLAFPYMAILSVMLIITWACCRQWFVAGAGILMIFLCWTSFTMQFPLHLSSKPAEGADTFKLLTWNVAHGIDFTGADSTVSRTFSTILREDADIVCLQEMEPHDIGHAPGLTTELLDSLYTKYPYRENWQSYDLQIWSKYPFTQVTPPEEYQYPNARIAEFDIRGHRLTLCNVHLTSYALGEDDQKVLSGMRSASSIRRNIDTFKHSVYRKLLSSFPARARTSETVIESLKPCRGATIVCGDFNDVPASWTYRLFIKDGFRDAYTATNFFYTDTFNKNLLLFHIDQIFYRGGVRPLCVDKIEVKSSDHYGLTAEFEFTDN